MNYRGSQSKGVDEMAGMFGRGNDEMSHHYQGSDDEWVGGKDLMGNPFVGGASDEEEFDSFMNENDYGQYGGAG